MSKKILIVDDDVDILDSVTALLELDDYQVKTTPKGDETRKLAKEYNPHVILLDLLLSGKDGSYICRELKADTELRHIPVVMMSAHPSANHQATAAGANDFIAKPFEADDLLGMLKKHSTSPRQ